MKKWVSLGITAVAALSLAACGNSNSAAKDSSSAKAKSESVAESSSKAKSISESKAESSSAKASSESAEQSSFDATLASETAAAKSASTASSTPATAESSSTQSETQESRPRSVIHGRDEAVAAAEAKYGNNGGDWVWGCLWSDDGSYFVKATSKSSTTMTKTAMSVMVYDDGSIVQQ